MVWMSCREGEGNGCGRNNILPFTPGIWYQVLWSGGKKSYKKLCDWFLKFLFIVPLVIRDPYQPFLFRLSSARIPSYNQQYSKRPTFWGGNLLLSSPSIISLFAKLSKVILSIDEIKGLTKRLKITMKRQTDWEEVQNVPHRPEVADSAVIDATPSPRRAPLT